MSAPISEFTVHVRYLISRDAYVSRRVLAGDLSVAPIPNALLATNAFGQFIANMLASHGDDSVRLFGDSFASIEAYRQAHPDAKCSRTDLEGYAYYDCVRKCSDQEFESRIGAVTEFNKILRDNGGAVDELCVAAADNSDCGDGSVTEEYLTRRPWVVFLALTNVTAKPIAIEEIIGLRDLSVEFRPLGMPNEDYLISMPACKIAADQSVLVPISLLLGPIQETGEDQIGIKMLADRDSFSEVMNLTCFSESGVSSFRVVGPSFTPRRLSICVAGSRIVQDIHMLDVTNVYTIDRVWRVGSCPHLFVITDNEEVHYLGELLAKGQCKPVNESISLPADTSRLLIAELEDEVSFLSEIAVDGRIVVRDVKLKKGDGLELDVKGAKMLELTGTYFPLTSKLDFDHSGLARNRLVCNFMANWTTSFPRQFFSHCRVASIAR